MDSFLEVLVKPTREKVWEGLYDQLSDYLEPLGKDSYRPNGDYSLLADDWGRQTQEIFFRKFSLVNRHLIEDFQEILRNNAPDWYVIISLDTSLKNGAGFHVYSDRVECLCDLEKLRKEIGDPNFFAS